MATRRPRMQIDDGEWVTISWKGQHEECCECGSKHRLDFRVLETGKLQMKATRIK